MKTVIADRYEIMSRVTSDGSTVIYIASDQVTGRPVLVREFFADRIMQRTENGSCTARAGCDVQYKSLRSDYEELCRYVISLKEVEGILHPLGVISCGGTVYCIEPAENMLPLEDYLAKSTARITWQQLKKQLAPIVYAARRMHADGFYHRGISARNIVVDNDGNFLLTGFDIPAARTADSEIESTLYFGYSAPEQYSSASWQGSWTDVYSLAAVCYRALTGSMPVEWRQRGKSRELLPAKAIEPSVPENVSNALMTALSIDIRNRYRTVEELWAGLLHGPGDTATVVIPSFAQAARPRRVNIGINTLFAVFAIMLLVVLISFNVVEYIIERYVGPPDYPVEPPTLPTAEPTPEPSPTEYRLPDFTGMSVEQVLQNELYSEYFLFNIEREYSETQSVGRVVSQSPAPYSVFVSDKMTVTLTMSIGTEKTTMPNVVGKSLEEAVALLSEREITFFTEEVVDWSQPVGTVLWSSVEYGEMIYRTKDKVNLRIARR